MTEIPKSHSVLGASNCERWFNCPGSVSLIEQMPKRGRESIYASEGVVAHAIGEWKLRKIFGEHDYMPEPKIEDVYEQDGHRIVVDTEMLDATEVYYELVKGFIDRYRLDRSDVQIEAIVQIPCDFESHAEMFGTADCILHVPYDRLIVIDYKHGAGHRVDVDNNKQLLYYALGAWFTLPTDQRDQLDVVQLVICQPRVPGGGIQSFELSTDRLRAFYLDLLDAVKRVKPGAEVKAGDWCRWCPAKPICPALRERVFELATVDFSEVHVLEAVAPPSLPAPASLPPQVVANLLDHTDMIKKWLDSVEMYAESLLESGVDVPGYKMVKKRTNRAWLDRQQTIDVLEPALGDDIYVDPKLKSPAQIEKLMKEQKFDEETISKVSALYHNPDKGKTIVKDVDSRQALTPSAIQDFIDINV